MTQSHPVVRRFICSSCNFVHYKWAARCSSCHSLKGMTMSTADLVEVPRPVVTPTAAVAAPEPLPEVEAPIIPIRSRLVIARPPPDPELTDPGFELGDEDDDDEDDPTPITEIEATKHQFVPTNVTPLDMVLGGGIVVGAVILLASPPGSGKTSLTLQALTGTGHPCIYASAEESKPQLAATAHRIRTVSPDLLLMHDQDLKKIFRKALKFKVRTIAIDSIQKMACSGVKGLPGSPTQLKACSERIRAFAKLKNISFIVICHINGDGDISGPKTIEHDVDVVLELVPGLKLEGNERILRFPSPPKNRFGATNIEGRFRMTATGLEPIDPEGWDEEF
jgi:predicted ATP-dependent serine protease